MKAVTGWILAAVLLMIGFPWLAVAFAGSNGMGVCFLLFFGVNPVFSVAAGIFSGKNIRKRWPIPMVVSGLFLIGVWLFFEMGEPAFLLYAGVYLLFGAAAMFLSALFTKLRKA